MPPLRLAGVPASWDVQASHNNDVVSLRDINILLAQNMSMSAATAQINADLVSYATQSWATSQMAGLATPSWTQSQVANYVPVTTVNQANGPVGLSSTTGRISQAVINAASSQQWPSPFWSPASYQTTSVTATSTPSLLYTEAIAYPGYTYVLFCEGMVDTQVSADNGTIPIVVVRVGSATGPIIALGYGCAESYAGPIPGTIASQAFVNQSTPTTPGFSVISGWLPQNTGGYTTTMVGNYLQVPETTTATLSASLTFSGASAATSTQLRIVDNLNNVIATGTANVAATTGTCTVSWTGGVTAGKLYGLQGMETISSGSQASWTGGTFTFIPPQVSNTGMANIAPVPFEYQTSLTGPVTLYVMLQSSTGTPVTASTLFPALWTMPIPWVTQIGATPAGVSYDATGAGSSNYTSSWSWLHSISGNAILVGIAAYGTFNPPTITVTVGGVAATQLGYAVQLYGSDYLTVFTFGLLNPPTGSQTIVVTSGSGQLYCAADSVSYYGVFSFGTAVTASDPATTTAALSASSATGQMVFNAMGCIDKSGSLTAYNQTTRYTIAASANNEPVLIGDAPGAATVNFSATVASGATGWAAIAVPLVPPL